MGVGGVAGLAVFWVGLCCVGVAALGLRLYAALGAGGLIAPDEVFQSLEQGHRLAFGYGMVPWEFRAGVRSWFLPGMLGGVMRGAAAVGSTLGGTGGPGIYLPVVATILCLFSIGPMVALSLLARRLLDRGDGGSGKGQATWPALVAAGWLGLWFEPIYFAHRALSEAVAAHVLLLGLCLAELRGRAAREVWSSADPGRRGLDLGTGLGAVLIGLAAGLRPQLGPTALVCAAYYAVRYAVGHAVGHAAGAGPVRARLWAAAGVLAAAALPLCALGLLDWVTWGTPSQSIWKYVWMNLAGGRSAVYGVSPAYAYLQDLARLWSFGALPILGLALFGAWRFRLWIFAAAVLVTIGVHSCIGHKEYRFIYPAVLLLLALAGLGAAALAAKIGGASSASPGGRRTAVASVTLLLATAALSLGLAGRLTRHNVRAYAPRPTGVDDTLWTANRDGRLALVALGQEARLCGVAIYGVPLFSTGGYSHLHRDVPLFYFDRPEALVASSSLFNAVLVPRADAERFPPFSPARCLSRLCMLMRPGACAPPPADYHINRVLERVDQ